MYRIYLLATEQTSLIKSSYLLHLYLRPLDDEGNSRVVRCIDADSGCSSAESIHLLDQWPPPGAPLRVYFSSSESVLELRSKPRGELLTVTIPIYHLRFRRFHHHRLLHHCQVSESQHQSPDRPRVQRTCARRKQKSPA